MQSQWPIQFHWLLKYVVNVIPALTRLHRQGHLLSTLQLQFRGSSHDFHVSDKSLHIVYNRCDDPFIHPALVLVVMSVSNQYPAWCARSCVLKQDSKISLMHLIDLPFSLTRSVHHQHWHSSLFGHTWGQQIVQVWAIDPTVTILKYCNIARISRAISTSRKI